MLLYGFITQVGTVGSLAPSVDLVYPPFVPSFDYSVPAEVPKLFNLCSVLQPGLLPLYSTGQHTPLSSVFPADRPPDTEG